jgi:uncharacterized membrane protein
MPSPRLIACLAILLATPAFATQELTPEPAMAYRVVGVAAGDVLNVRRDADAAAEKVGNLPADADDVVATGSRVEWNGSVWWGVLLDDGTRGWVNARFLMPVSADPDPETFPLACFGTEPFWSLKIVGTRAVFSAPDSEETFVAGETAVAIAHRGRLAVPLSAGGGHGALAAFRTYDFCSDGMSDTSYPYEAVLMTPGGAVYSGCCERAGR